jgi:hypothetical protein
MENAEWTFRQPRNVAAMPIEAVKKEQQLREMKKDLKVLRRTVFPDPVSPLTAVRNIGGQEAGPSGIFLVHLKNLFLSRG